MYSQIVHHGCVLEQWVMKVTLEKQLMKITYLYDCFPNSQKRVLCAPPTPIAVIKYSVKQNFMKKVFILAHSSREQSIMMEKLSQQELETAGPITSTVSKQRAVDTGCCSVLSLAIQSRVSASEWCHPQWAGLPTSVNVIKIPLCPTGISRGLSMVRFQILSQLTATCHNEFQVEGCIHIHLHITHMFLEIYFPPQAQYI